MDVRRISLSSNARLGRTVRRQMLRALGAITVIALAACAGTGASSVEGTPQSVGAAPTAATASASRGQDADPEVEPSEEPAGAPRGRAVVMLDDVRYEFDVGYEFEWGDGPAQCLTMNGWFSANGPGTDDSGLGLLLLLPPEETQSRDWEAEPARPGELLGPPQFTLVLLETLEADWEERSETMTMDEFYDYQPYTGLTDAWRIEGLTASGSADVTRVYMDREQDPPQVAFFVARATFEVSCG